MKVFRKTGEPNTYTQVAHDGPRDLAPSTVNTFQTSLQVKAGDILGNNHQAGTTECQWNTGDPGDSLRLFGPPGLADGQPGDFASLDTSVRLNVSADITPTNTFTLSGTTRNKKKGTAKLAVTVPNPGTLTVSGNGVRTAGSPAEAAVSVSAAGTVTVPIRAKGKRKQQLNSTGKVKVKPTITYTPTGGTARSQSLKAKLKRNI